MPLNRRRQEILTNLMRNTIPHAALQCTRAHAHTAINAEIRKHTRTHTTCVFLVHFSFFRAFSFVVILQANIYL